MRCLNCGYQWKDSRVKLCKNCGMKFTTPKEFSRTGIVMFNPEKKKLKKVL